jgi:stage II sporulation protein AA (anti-sigma F factor antagonist)
VENGREGAPQAAPGAADPEETAPDALTPKVSHVRLGETAMVSVVGELTEAARRPLVRTMTDLLLAPEPPKTVQLDLRRVEFANSAGLALLVQLQRMASPRGVEVALLVETAAVARPLKLTGLWHRFTVIGDTDS